MSLVQAVSESLVWHHSSTTAGGHVRQKLGGSPCSVLLLTVKSKEAALAVILMTASTQLKKRNIQGFSDNS